MSQTDPHSDDPLVGTQVREFLIVSKVGEGGMGSVYKAYHQILHQHRAMKVLKKELTGDETFIARFLREAKALVEVNHTNVARFFEFFRHEDGTLFMVMEFVEGESLEQRIRSCGYIAEKELLPIIRQVCEGLAEAHRHGIIHRDISPDNIMLVPRGPCEEVKILDFGIAKNPKDPDRTQMLTQVGTFIGKYKYCSPEQAQGLAEESLDIRSDIYSLGVVMYEMLTGTLPFDADNPQAYVFKQMSEEPIPVSERTSGPACSSGLERLIHKLLEKDRKQRPGDIQEVLGSLNEIETNRGTGGEIPDKEIETLPVAESESREDARTLERPPSSTWLSRHRKALALTFSLLFVFVSVLIVYFLLSGPHKGTSVITVTSVPSGAEIFIDDVLQPENTPYTVKEIRANETHVLNLHKEGYEGWTRTFNLEPGAVRLFTARLREE